jgi:hypothetical protein
MPETPRTAAQQEAAAEEYWQRLIAQNRQAVEQDAKTARVDQTALTQDAERLRESEQQVRRARHVLRP